MGFCQGILAIGVARFFLVQYNKTLQNVPKVMDLWSENKPSGNPVNDRDGNQGNHIGLF
jgi:hypothetical protein